MPSAFQPLLLVRPVRPEKDPHTARAAGVPILEPRPTNVGIFLIDLKLDVLQFLRKFNRGDYARDTSAYTNNSQGS